MSGLRSFIRNRLPESWKYILKQEKKITAFVEYVYRDTPNTMKGKNYKHGRTNILVGYKRVTIDKMFNSSNSIEGKEYWKKIAERIAIYEFNCN